eukprot:PhM_4_TR17241/c0_g1_i1/m.36162
MFTRLFKDSTDVQVLLQRVGMRGFLPCVFFYSFHRMRPTEVHLDKALAEVEFFQKQRRACEVEDVRFFAIPPSPLDVLAVASVVYPRQGPSRNDRIQVTFVGFLNSWFELREEVLPP